MVLVLVRLVADRDAGMDAEHAARRSVEAARAARLLVIPAPGALSERLTWVFPLCTRRSWP